WTDYAALLLEGSWFSVTPTPIPCVYAPSLHDALPILLTQAGVDSIVDSVGAVWTLGPPDASGFPTKARNGVVDGSAAVLCYSGRSDEARCELQGGGWIGCGH